MTDDDRLAAIEAKLAKITPYTWRWVNGGFDRHHVLKAGERELLSNTLPGYVNTFISLSVPGPEADLIAAAPDDLRYLLARARQLDALADAVLAGRWTEADEIARRARGG